MGDHTPIFDPGKAVTRKAGAAITGGQLLKPSTAADETVLPTTGVGVVSGVAAYDAATGQNVLVRRGGTHKLIANGAITRGDRVQAAAAGAVSTWGGTAVQDICGYAESSAANGALVIVVLPG